MIKTSGHPRFCHDSKGPEVVIFSVGGAGPSRCCAAAVSGGRSPVRPTVRRGPRGPTCRHAAPTGPTDRQAAPRGPTCRHAAPKGWPTGCPIGCPIGRPAGPAGRKRLSRGPQPSAEQAGRQRRATDRGRADEIVHSVLVRPTTGTLIRAGEDDPRQKGGGATADSGAPSMVRVSQRSPSRNCARPSPNDQSARSLATTETIRSLGRSPTSISNRSASLA